MSRSKAKRWIGSGRPRWRRPHCMGHYYLTIHFFCQGEGSHRTRTIALAVRMTSI